MQRGYYLSPVSLLIKEDHLSTIAFCEKTYNLDTLSTLLISQSLLLYSFIYFGKMQSIKSLCSIKSIKISNIIIMY